MPSKDIVAQILLGEAAGEGPAGLAFVRDVLVNRARAQGKTLEEVATAPKQFSASSRPDLEQFYQRQPLILRTLAQHLVDEARNPKFVPQYEVQHYVTRALYDRRHEPGVASWIKRMTPVATIGNHVALQDTPSQ